MSWDGGDYPLKCVVLGGEILYGGSDYIMSLKSPRTVADVAKALPGMTEETLRAASEGRHVLFTADQ